MKRIGQISVLLFMMIGAGYLAGCINPGHLSESGVVSNKDANVTKSGGPSVKILDNGMTVIARRRPGTRMFAMSVFAWDRSGVDKETGVPGACDFLARMLPMCSEEMSGNEIERRLALIGGELQTADNPFIPFDDRYFGREYVALRFDCLGRFMSEGVDLLAGLVGNPCFSDSEAIASTREEMRTAIAMSSRSPSMTGRDLFYRTLFGGTPFELPVSGTMKSLTAVDDDVLKRTWQLLFDPSNMVVSMVGDEDPLTMIDLADKTFGTMTPHGGKSRIRLMSSPEPLLKKDTCIKIPGAGQVSISMGNILEPMSNDELRTGRVALAVLSDRLAADLRETRGLAYSVGAGCAVEPDFAFFRISIGTSPSNFDTAIIGIKENISALRKGPVSHDEIEAAVNGIRGSEAMRRLSSLNQAFDAAEDIQLGPGRNTRDFLEDAGSVTEEEVVAWMAKYIDPERLITVSAGPDCEQ